MSCVQPEPKKVTVPNAPVKKPRLYPKMKAPTREKLFHDATQIHKYNMAKDATKVFKTGGVGALSAKQLAIIVDYFHDTEIALPGIGMDKCRFYLVHKEDVEHLSPKDFHEYVHGTSDLFMFHQCADERTKRGYR